MLQHILVLLALSPAVEAQPSVLVALAQQDQRAEFDKRLKDARGDREKLWELHRWTEARSMRSEGRRVLREILNVDEGDPRANELLGHVLYDGRWFKNEKELEAYKRERAEAEAKERGLVEWNGEWVTREDLPYLQRGLVRAPSGDWVRKDELDKINAGWVRQDLEWVAPEDAGKIAEGLWKCGDQWLELAAANEYHSHLDQWWRLPGRYFQLYTTLPRDEALKLLVEVDAVAAEMERFFGIMPAGTPHVLVLNSIEQYSTFAAGESNRRRATESHGLSSAHGAYFADIWIDAATREHLGAGVCYLDLSSEDQRRFGRHFVRHAAGLSFVEAVDGSPKTLAAFQKSKRAQFDLDGFHGEKRVPALLRTGIASYVDRYFIDRTAKVGAATEWPRKWSVENLERRGGIPAIDKLIQFPVNGGDPETAGQLINAAGLVVGFILDGNDPEVTSAHGEWKQAFAEGKDMKGANQKLLDMLRAKEAQMRQYSRR